MMRFSLLESSCKYIKFVGTRNVKFALVFFYKDVIFLMHKLFAQNSTVQNDESKIKIDFFADFRISVFRIFQNSKRTH